MTTHKVVVIGSGFGGLFATKALRRADVDITMIDRTTHHLFQPLLYQVATGILSEGEIAPTTRMVLKDQDNVAVRLGEVTDIDLAHRRVVTEHDGHRDEVAYDSLIVAAGARQSYFGNDHFARHAPGLKTVDDALELRSRIIGAFEAAEITDDDVERRRLLTFVVVGAGPTGVEMAGQIAELAHHTLADSFSHIDPRDARVILVDAATQVLPPFGERLGARAAESLERLGVEVMLGAMVVDVADAALTVRRADGSELVIDSACKVWSAGVAASPLARHLAEQCGAEVDRAGRIRVNDDLTLPGHPNVFVVGDMISLDGLPGVAQVAIQGGRYAAQRIAETVRGADHGRDSRCRSSFRYRDKGSMATISRMRAVAKIGRVELTGFTAWLMWLLVHLVYVVGFRSRITTVLSWTWTFLGLGRGQMVTTAQQATARNALAELAEIDSSRKVLDDDPADSRLGDDTESRRLSAATNLA